MYYVRFKSLRMFEVVTAYYFYRRYYCFTTDDAINGIINESLINGNLRQLGMFYHCRVTITTRLLYRKKLVVEESCSTMDSKKYGTKKTALQNIFTNV